MTLSPPADDPYLWLEEVQGERALAWVRARNAQSEQLLAGTPEFEASRERILEVLDSREQIPYVARRGQWLYNLWQDAANPRGLWRRTTLAEYRKSAPAWQTVLDVDALGRAEGRNWVWKGAACLGPSYRRCLVKLSLGGADAVVVREFDTVDKRFVDGGFMLPEAKTDVVWLDADTLLVGTDFGAGSLTDSGYPRQVRRLRRGQPLAEAALVFEGATSDVAVGAHVDRTPGFERTVIVQALDFYRNRVFLLRGDVPVEVPKPADAQLEFWRRHLLIALRSDWEVGGRHYRAGSLLIADAEDYLRTERRFELLFEPGPGRSYDGHATTRSAVLVQWLDNVASRVDILQPAAGGRGWQRQALAAPYPGTIAVASLHDPLLADDALAEHFLLNAADFLAPDSLRLGRVGGELFETLKSRPGFFDAAGMRVEQHFATSADGTRVPYFVLWPRDAQPDGDNPTLLHGYGGFEVAMQPHYSGVIGREWLTRGGVYVVANIRGGGEFGPAWHQAALQRHRQKSFDDFIAVAEDLIARRITRAPRLGIEGGSNGGLLVGAVMVQRPELFGAVVCQVPLLDMRRYHKLLAGASWIAEYGNPDDADDWAAMQRWSPYHNVPAAARRRLPAVLFTTSTRDDRVHPGHARKMAARMEELGHAPLYWENTEGGHGGAADNAQRATMMALEFSFLWRMLRRP
ncbi:MAG TPA: prolyl oligopeptidase family serine peptidase [Rubrivivax sp.]|nr:prolyl oligopeptidase family serine peptidase [Rubrivivax sp.]